MTLSETLNIAQINSMKAIYGGADVFSYSIAKNLREVEVLHPEFIQIVKCMGNYDGAKQLPYFGAILTDAGRNAIDIYNSGN